MKIYIASKAYHGSKWLALKNKGIPIISTWINEYEKGATSDFSDLWIRCINEAKECDVLIVYREQSEILKGAWVEVGAALSNNKKVYAIGCSEFSIKYHPMFFECPSIEEALKVLGFA